jgi:AraC-like DNA-binding protein
LLREKVLTFFERSNSCPRIHDVGAPLFRTDELRVAIKLQGYCVKILAERVGVDVRTLERRFNKQFRMTPKRWIMRERMNFAAPLLAEGLSNKEVAASLGYSHESNFCRDFKKAYSSAPQKFARSNRFVSS